MECRDGLVPCAVRLEEHTCLSGSLHDTKGVSTRIHGCSVTTEVALRRHKLQPGRVPGPPCAPRLGSTIPDQIALSPRLSCLVRSNAVSAFSLAEMGGSQKQMHASFFFCSSESAKLPSRLWPGPISVLGSARTASITPNAGVSNPPARASRQCAAFLVYDINGTKATA